MSRHHFTLTVEVDDEALDAHDGNHTAPPNDVEDWDARDLFLAAEKGLIDPGESEVIYEGEVTS